MTILPSTDRRHRRVGADVLDRHVEQQVAGLRDVRALRERRVAVATGEHEVVGDEADGVGVGPTGVSVPLGPSGAFHEPSITGVVPLQWYRDLQAGDLREAAGGDRRVADRG